MRAPFRNPRRGTTLIEVLATMVVIAIVLPVAMRGISLATTLAGLTQQRGQATALAESKLSELQATGDWELGNLTGDFGEQSPGYTWEAWVETWDDLSLEQLSVAVKWTSRGSPREIVLATLVTSTSLSTE